MTSRLRSGFAFIMGCVCWTGTALGQASPHIDWITRVNETDDPTQGGFIETAIAVDPLNPSRLIAAAIWRGRNEIYYGISTNGGLSFPASQRGALPRPTGACDCVTFNGFPCPLFDPMV